MSFTSMRWGRTAAGCKGRCDDYSHHSDPQVEQGSGEGRYRAGDEADRAATCSRDGSAGQMRLHRSIAPSRSTSPRCSANRMSNRPSDHVKAPLGWSDLGTPSGTACDGSGRTYQGTLASPELQRSPGGPAGGRSGFPQMPSKRCRHLCRAAGGIVSGRVARRPETDRRAEGLSHGGRLDTPLPMPVARETGNRQPTTPKEAPDGDSRGIHLRRPSCSFRRPRAFCRAPQIPRPR